jgi:CRP-like cAMP-binding protein
MIFEKGKPADSLMVILKGEIDITDHVATIETCKSGCCIGEPALLREPTTRMCSVQANTPVTALVLDRADWLKLADRNPQLAIKVYDRLAWLLASKLRATDENYASEITDRNSSPVRRDG